MKQKLLSFILLLSVGISAAHAYSFSKVAPSGQTLYFNITSSGSSPKVSVTYPGTYSNPWSGYTKPTGSLIIPANVTNGGNTYSVTSIGNGTFYNCVSLTSITIPNSVTSIGGYSFYNCVNLSPVTIPNSVTSIGESAFANSSLTSVTIPNSVISIGDYAFSCPLLASVTIGNSVTLIGEGAFRNCINLTSVTIPNSVTFIGDKIFEYCSSLASVTIGNSVTSIGEAAFKECSSLASVIIGNSVTLIGDSAFYHCNNLASVTIPNSVTSIGDYAFDYCSGLTSLTIPNSVTSIGDYAFLGCSGLTSLTIPNSVTSIGRKVFEYCCSLASVTIPNSVTSIGNSAFSYCDSLASVIIPNSITAIGDSLFYSCRNLASVTIPNSVTSIGNYAFGYCTGLTSLTIPNSVTTIGSGAFENCRSLTSVTIPDSVTSIGNLVFYGCNSLTSVTIPNTVRSIGNNAFSFCSSLDSVTIPDSVTLIGEGAFSRCSSLTSVTIPNSITWIGNNAFSSCSNLASVTIPNSVRWIGAGAFEYCRSLTSVTIPNSVTRIWNRTFSYCSNLASVTIPNTVTMIGESVFSNCSTLTSITIPNSVTSIGNWAFYKCSSLASVTAKPTVACSMSSNVFDDVPSNIPVYIPCGSRSSYSSVSGGWRHFSNFLEVMFDSVHVASADESMGTAAVVTQPTCASPTATIAANPNAGYTFTNWTENGTVVSTDATYTFSVTADRTLTAHFAPATTCGIAATDLPYTDNFDSYTNSTTAKTGVQPDCWTLAHQEVAMADEYKPMIYYSSANAHSGNYSLLINKRGIYAMPEFDGNVSTLQLSMYLKQGMAKYQLQVGVMSDLSDVSTFVPVATLNNSGTGVEHVTVSFAPYTGTGRYIAFRNILAAGNSGDFSCNYIDDLVLDLRPVNTCTGITVDDLPYTDNFDSYTTSRTAKTGVEPDCWTLAHQDVSMADEYKPMVYYASSNAHSGSYSLILNKRGIYAMPEFDGEISSLQLSMYVKQGQAKYILQVGVMSNLSDANTFVPVATINNSSTAPVLNTVSFANYTGSGHYIAFRNILASGYSGDFSCNYIDDLVLDLRPINTCTGITVDDLPYTDNFDSYTASTTAKTGVAPECWTLAYQEVEMTDEYKPMIYYNSTNAHSGSYSLILNKRCLYAMPAYDGDVSTLQLSFYLKQTNASYGLTVGVMSDLSDPGTFVPVASFNNPSTANHEYVVVDFSSYTGNGHYIAFRNTNTAISNFSCNYIDDLTLDLRPSNCGITVDDLPYTDNFDSYTTSTTAKTGVAPDCWTLAYQEVAMTDEYKPMIYYNSSNAHSGSYSLLINKRCLYTMPAYDGNVSALQLSFYLKQTSTNYGLTVGVMSDLEDPSTFVPVASFNNPSTANHEYVVVDFSSYTGDGHFIAFRNTNTAISTFSCNYIDDLTLELRTGGCGITVADLPYTDNFDSYTVSTTPKTGVALDCWTLAHQDVVMTEEYKPMIYYNASCAHSSSYSLMLNKRGIYAMPAYEGDVRDLQLSFYVRQTQVKYQLQVGVMTDLSNASTFVPVATFNNTSTTTSVLRTVNFASYTGNGHYIAFRNILAAGQTGDYSCNYIDDLTLSMANAKGEMSDEDYGIDEHYELAVYPNPTTGMLTVEADEEVVRVEVYDYTGRSVATFERQATIDLSRLATGIYTLRVTLPERIEVRRVVKQ